MRAEMPEKHFLLQMKALPLRAKVMKTQLRIREWYEHFDGDVCVSFSGGKDSTVLAALVRDLYPDVPLIFANTGLEYPEIQAFARKIGAEFVRPKMRFDEVISTYGYPIISKENAEAIYYARKIRNSVGGGTRNLTEREQSLQAVATSHGGYEQKRKLSDQKRNELNGSRISMGGVQYGRSVPPQGESDEPDRTVLPRGRIGWIRANLTDSLPDTRKTDWKDWRRNAVAGVGEFAPSSTSIYNKSKWLPLCRDTQFMISHYCCAVMKKGPMKIYQKKAHRYPYIGTLTEESKLREQAWIKHGCNAFDAKIKTSQPMSFWTEQDVLHYIYEEGLEIASVYGEIVAVDKDGMEYETPFFASQCDLKCTGCQRTGCIFCGFGVHLEKGETRFQRLAKTHPRQYEYCMGGGQWVDNPKYDPAAPKMDGDWVNWNPKKIWVPSKEGLGMKKVFDDCNQIYGRNFIRYE